MYNYRAIRRQRSNAFCRGPFCVPWAAGSAAFRTDGTVRLRLPVLWNGWGWGVSQENGTWLTGWACASSGRSKRCASVEHERSAPQQSSDSTPAHRPLSPSAPHRVPTRPSKQVHTGAGAGADSAFLELREALGQVASDVLEILRQVARLHRACVRVRCFAKRAGALLLPRAGS